MQRDVFASLSPLDHRYYASEPDLFEQLSSYLSENAYVGYQLRVEAALTRAWARHGFCSSSVADEVSRAVASITPAQVYTEEETTRHSIRAMVNCIRRQVSREARPFVHLGATSSDIMDTARAMQYRDVTDQVIIPQLKELLCVLIQITRREADTLQVGRTHGQHAVPMTFGFAMAEYISRLGNRTITLEKATASLCGKMSGAVGAYNAVSLFLAEPENFEREVLADLGLRPATHSTQITEPEYVLDWAHGLISTLGVLANLGDDIRHLQRSEIAEVGEVFAEEQVGSSTMPHKRNPWNFEHVKSIWKAFCPRMLTLYMDQISEHQRDLTNSASQRFVPEIVVALVATTKRLTRVMRKLVVDRRRMMDNLDLSKEMMVAEPLYVLLAALGHPDAHEVVRQLTLTAERTGRPLRVVAAESPELAPYLGQMEQHHLYLLEHPETYVGIAAKKARNVADHWERVLQLQIGADA